MGTLWERPHNLGINGHKMVSRWKSKVDIVKGSMDIIMGKKGCPVLV